MRRPAGISHASSSARRAVEFRLIPTQDITSSFYILEEGLSHSLVDCICHLVLTLCFSQWLELWEVKLFNHISRSGGVVWLETFTFILVHSFTQLFFLILFELVFLNRNVHSFTQLFLLILFELVFLNRNTVAFINFTDYWHVEASGSTGLAKRCVDTKINTLKSEGKCSPSSEKSTKRASQFDLQLIRIKQKLNPRAYRLEF